MSAFHILILEDEALIAMDLEAIVLDFVPATISLHATLASARRALDTGPVSFVLLDISLPDGNSYDLARRLRDEGTPFAFISAYVKDALPADLRECNYVQKPFKAREIIAVQKMLLASLDQRDSDR